MYVSAIVLAAGRGLRLKSKIPKPLARICSQPVIAYSLEALSRHHLIKGIIVAVNPENLKGIEDCIKKYKIAKVTNIVLGGLRRQDSVRAALEVVKDSADLVLVHDAARPFINQEMLSNVIKEAGRHRAAIVGVPVKATIKEVESMEYRVESRPIVKKTLDRERLWEIQTPQVFKKDLILEAYRKFGNIDATDDAMLVERLGVPVRVVTGAYSNIKITTPEDLKIARAICQTG